MNLSCMSLQDSFVGLLFLLTKNPTPIALSKISLLRVCNEKMDHANPDNHDVCCPANGRNRT